MYDFPEIWEHTDALWSSVAAHLQEAGLSGVPEVLTRPTEPLAEHWLRPDVFMSQTCGYPVVRQLTPAQHLLGSFSVQAGDPERPGWYRSVLVCRTSDSRGDGGLGAFGGALAVANDDGSLSGWVSLGFAMSQAGIRPGGVSFSGGHEFSVTMVTDGSADLACIDAHSFALLSTHRRHCVSGLRIIGYGPSIAVTPLFTAQPELLESLRAAVTAAVQGLSVTARTALMITGFVPHGREAFEPVRAMAVEALTVLPA